MTAKIASTSVALTVVLVALAHAQAPPIQLPQTGQLQCWGQAAMGGPWFQTPCAGTGQDGEFRAGSPLPEPRFIDHGNGLVTDNLTGLVWTRDANPFDAVLSRQQATERVASMNAGLYQNYGFADWRLPTRQELLSFFEYQYWPPLNTGPFTNLQFSDAAGLAFYWSSTCFGADTCLGSDGAWAVWLANGKATRAPDGSLFSFGYVWPVRGDSSQVPRTGWPGDTTGVEWPIPRFTPQGDGTVRDDLTGLIWTGRTNLGGWLYGDTWSTALAHVATMNAGLAPNFGHTDWRLPNVRELESLIDLSGANPALPPGHPFMVSWDPDVVCTGPCSPWLLGHWTSTSDAFGTAAWAVTFEEPVPGGTVSLDSMESRHHVWAVRGGQLGLIHAVTGTVTDAGTGLGLAGITITLSGTASATAVTASDGSYRFAGLANGDYTVTPTQVGYTFFPSSAAVAIADGDATQDFAAAWFGGTHSIGGTITENGVGLAGVSVALGGDASGTVTTATDGSYQITGLPDGNYTLTPTWSGYAFTPASAAVTVAGGDATQDFTATARNPIVLSGPDYAMEGYDYPYSIGLDNQSATTLVGPLTLDIEVSPGLQFASEWADEWSCAPGAPGHYLCTLSGDLWGGATSQHVLVFTITQPPHAAACGTGPSPCVAVRATLTGTSHTAILYTGVDHSGGSGNSIPRATDDVAWVYGALTFSPLSNDYDFDHDPLTLTIETPPTAGTVVINANGTVKYTPDDWRVSGPDSFRYRVSDGRGGSATALVSINSVTPVLSANKAVIDAGPVAPGRLVSAWTYLTSSWGINTGVSFAAVSDAEIAAALAETGYDPRQAVSDPGAFRGEPAWFASSEWDPPWALSPPTRRTEIYFRPSQTIGQVSVARVVFTAYYVRDSLPGAALATTAAYVIGMSGDPLVVPVMARDDAVTTPVDTPIEIDVLANDTSLADRDFGGIPFCSGYSNLEACVFDGLCESPVPGGLLNRTADGRRVIHYPSPGWTGTTSFTYGVREPMDPVNPRPYDDNMYYARITVTVGAAPEPAALVVTKAGNGAGTITSTPGAIDCGATCSAMLPPGSEIVLRAHASVGSTFAGWSGACAGTGPCNLVVDAATSVTATFTLQSFPLSIAKSGTGSGTVTSSPPSIDCGTTCEASFEYGTALTLTPTPAPGSRFTGWTGACRGPGPCVMTIDGARSVVAEFTLESFTLTVAKSGIGSSSVVSEPAGIDCGATCSASFSYGAEVTLTAMPAAGSLFTGWSGLACHGTETSCVLTIDADTSVGATFVSPPDVSLEQSIWNLSSGASSQCCLTAQDGDLLIFYFTARNAATAQPTTGPVTLSVTVPVGLDIEEANEHCSRAGQLVTCVSSDTLGAGDYVEFNVHARVATGVGVGQSVELTNAGTVSTPGDVNAGNDTSGTATITVSGPGAPDVNLEQSVWNFSSGVSSQCCVTAQGGDLLIFYFTARNAAIHPTIGPVTLSVTVPTGLDIEEANEHCSRSGQVVTCVSRDTLGAGDYVEFNVHARVATGVLALPGETATVTSTGIVATSDDANPSDNRSNLVTITVHGPAGVPLPGGGTMGIVVPSSQALAGVTLDQTTYTVPAGVQLPFGAIRYTVTLGPGETSSSATMIFTPPLPPRLVLYKADTGAVLGTIPVCGTTLFTDCWTRQDTATSTIIVLMLSDNGPFDLNPAVGVIADPVLFGIIVNQPPVADAGVNQTVEATTALGAAVTLSGSGLDPDGDPLTFAWSGPCGSASGAVATLTCPLGSSTMTLSVGDGAHGGTSTATVQITVADTTPPALACSSPGTAWHAADATVACSATDAAAGLSNPDDASFVLSTSVLAGVETADAMTGARTVCDAAGNCATAGPIGPVKVDKLAPSIIVGAPVDGASYLLSQSLPAAFSCGDGGAGVVACTGDVADGAMLVTNPVGPKTFTITATDAVGNTAIVSRTYRVIFASDGLCEGAAGHAILEPIAQGASSVFKQGRTVPAKFRVCDAGGQSIGTPGTVSSFRLTQIVSGTATEDANADVPSTTPDLSFRWDLLARQWIYNISTSSFQPGRTYYFVVTLSDGTNIGFGFGLR